MTRQAYNSVRDTRSTSRGTDWRHFSACQDTDPELHFPIGNTGPALIQAEQAKAVCRRCPVKTDCLNFALDSGQDAGVWGGKTEEERRAMRHHRGVTARVIRPAA